MGTKGKKKPTTLERFQAAKKDYEAKKYSTIEEAARANDICPATYYNYQNSMKGGQVKVQEIKGAEGMDALDIARILDENVRLKQVIADAPTTKRDAAPANESLIDRLADRIIEKIFLKF